MVFVNVFVMLSTANSFWIYLSELCLIKSRKNGKYLKTIKPWTYQVTGKIPPKDARNPHLKPFMWKLVPKDGQESKQK